MLTAAYFWSLTAIAIACGVAMLPAFRRFSKPERVRLVKRQLRAHLYEFRLFADEPALLFRAQKALVVWNARYLGLMLRPTAVIILPMAALLYFLDPVYGYRALHAGEQTLVHAEVADSVDLRGVMPALSGSGFAVETPAVRIPDRHEVYWRVRAAGGRLRRLSVDTPARRVEVAYPPASLSIFGFGVHWLIWFFLVSSVTMFALRRRFHVTF